MKATALLMVACLILLLSPGLAAYPDILWWYDLDAPSFGSAAVGDIDGDDKLEIVFGTYFGDERIHALNAESGDTLWTFDTGGCNDASPAIADVDLDGELEVIVCASSPSMVYCFNGATGGVEWSTSTSPNHIDSPPAIADVDNDNRPEVVFGAFYGYLYCLNGEDGSECWSTLIETGSYIQSGPNILDVDDNGQLDIVIAQWFGSQRVIAVRGDDHSQIWQSTAPTDDMYHGGSFADVDEDGKPEIAIGCYDGTMYLLNAEDGSTEWTYPTSAYVGAPTSIADLNNDGHLEIVLVSYNQVITVSHEGDYLWSCATGGSVFRGVAIADIDGDDTLDVVFGSDDGILRVRSGSDGAAIWSLDLEAHYGNTFGMDHAPVVADLDDDGSLDVFIIGGYGTSSTPSSNHGRAYAVSGGDGNGPGWPMFRHDLRHSACFEPAEAVCGDFDGDGRLTISDIVQLYQYIFAGGPPPVSLEMADIDACGSVNVADLAYFDPWIVQGWIPPCTNSVECYLPAGGNSVSFGCPLEVYSAEAESVAIPVYITNTVPLVGYSLGFHYDSDDIEITSADVDGAILGYDFPFQFLALPNENQVLIGWCDVDHAEILEPQSGGLLATLWAMIPAGTPSQTVDIDSIFVAPAGEFILAPETFSAIEPEFFDCGEAEIVIKRYMCGDCDGNNMVNISDAVFLIAFIFAGGPPPAEWEETGDVDCNEIINISDAVYLISYIFGGGPEPCAECP